MNVEKINKKGQKKRILVAPLDWGLGHATRCIPIIRSLMASGAEVVLAADGAISTLLENEFPELEMLPLKGYNIRYGSNKIFFLWKMILQVPKVLSAITYERKWLNDAINRHRIDAVIADNRFGMHSTKVSCSFITHQLFIQTGNKLLNKLAQKINYRYINRFTECWVPDVATEKNIAGLLSHPKKLPKIPVSYLGLLSRCEHKVVTKDIDLLVLISGPEPQRTIFENILLKELKDFSGTAVMLRGLPAASNTLLSENKKLSIINHLPAIELCENIQRSKLVVARAGYSTIMDLVALQQKAILIPTPGQSEQEYLAGHLKEKKIFFTTTQENFSLKESLEKLKSFQFSELNISPFMNKEILVKWISNLE